MKYDPVKLPELTFGIRADARTILNASKDQEIEAIQEAAGKIIIKATMIVAILAQADGFDSLVLPPEAQAHVTAILQEHLSSLEGACQS